MAPVFEDGPTVHKVQDIVLLILWVTAKKYMVMCTFGDRNGIDLHITKLSDGLKCALP